MDAQIAKRQTRAYNKKKTGPMGVTDVNKGKIRLNISDDAKRILWMIIECVIIGFLINVMMHNFGFRIGIINSLGWTILWWILRFKLPEVRRRY